MNNGQNKCNKGILTFVILNESNVKIKVPPAATEVIIQLFLLAVRPAD